MVGLAPSNCLPVLVDLRLKDLVLTSARFLSRSLNSGSSEKISLAGVSTFYPLSTALSQSGYVTILIGPLN